MTIAGVRALVAADPTVSDSRRKSVATSLRCFCRLLGLDPTTELASPQALQRLIDRFRPARAGIRKDRWQNILVDLRFALRVAGFDGVPGRDLAPPSPAWQALLMKIEDRSIKTRLGRFGRWGTRRRIEPDQVDQEVFERFSADLANTPSSRRSAKATPDNVARAWNRAAETIEGWPAVHLQGLAVPVRWTLPLDAYPLGLQHEVEAYLASLDGRDLFDDAAPTRPLRPATLDGQRRHLRAYLGALVAAGREPVSLSSLRDLVEIETVKSGLRALSKRSKTEALVQVRHVAHLLRAIARHWVKVETAHLDELRAINSRLAKRRQKGLTPKNRDRLRPFDDPRNVGRLLHLPGDLMREARRAPKRKQRAALLAQTAVAIELLIMTRVRIGNLASLDAERDLTWTMGGRNGVAHLHLPAERVKNRQPLEFELPREVADLLRIYLDDFRPVLTRSAASPWLFPGRNGAHKCLGRLRNQITETVVERVGLDMHPHLFRHFAGKVYLDRHPGGYEVLRRVLGHRSLETTTGFYAGAETAAANRHFDRVILQVAASTAVAHVRKRR